MPSVAVIDYGMGNLHSISKALQAAAPSVDVSVTADPGKLLSADRVVFPGVGAMRDCINALRERDLPEILQRIAASKPLLGICLGMQALLDESEENQGVAGLSLMPGRVVRFAPHLAGADGGALKIPHMGWNRVHPTHAHPLWEGISPGSWFYFVHSYHARPDRAADAAATADYPGPFVAALARDNLFAVQFHPEKSQASGLRLLANFLSWDPARAGQSV